MSNVNMEGLPPEMQARIANIIEGAKQKAIANAAAPASQAPVVAPVATPTAPAAPKPPSLMDHVIMLRQEVAALNSQLAAQGQVVEAVGNAVGQLYAMFHQQTEVTTYSQGFQEAEPGQIDDY